MDDVNCSTTGGYKLVPDNYHLTLRRAYYSVVTFMDAQLGKVLDALDKSGLASTTAIVFWGDHGYQLGEHGEWCKITNFELATRVPLIVSLPNQPNPGSVSDALAEHLDMYPTLVEAAGLPSRGDKLQGKSLVPLIMASASAGAGASASARAQWNRTASFSQIQHGSLMGLSLRTETYRYTEWLAFDKHFDTPTPPQPKFGKTAPEGNTELYDHTGDDGMDMDAFENVNLAAAASTNATIAAVVQQMHDLLVKIWDNDGAGASGSGAV
jgi:iduronate 2-sulfatase